MRDEYDFSDAEQGKFYRPIEELDVPIYLDQEIKDFFLKKIRRSDQTLSLSKVVNSLLKKDIEISNQLTS
ncbi:Toxin-antitoxin system HicB family antitoxin [Candidatus Electrothrix laxa]